MAPEVVLADKLVAVVSAKLQRQINTLTRKVKTRERQRDQWMGQARCHKADLQAATKRIAELEAEVARLLPFENIDAEEE